MQRCASEKFRIDELFLQEFILNMQPWESTEIVLGKNLPRRTKMSSATPRQKKIGCKKIVLFPQKFPRI